VRLAPEFLARIDAVCHRMGLTSRSHVIKMCASTFLDHFESTGGACSAIPWESILKNLDGRTHRYRNTRPSSKPPETETKAPPSTAAPARARRRGRSS